MKTCLLFSFGLLLYFTLNTWYALPVKADRLAYSKSLSSNTALPQNDFSRSKHLIKNNPSHRLGFPNTNPPEHSLSTDYKSFYRHTEPCNSASPPFTQDFEAPVPPAIPNCGSLENTGNGNDWETYDASQESIPGINGQVLRYHYDVYNAADAWYFTQGIDLEAGTTYQLIYTYANSTPNPNFFEKLKVAYGPDPMSSLMTTLKDHPHISGGMAQADTVFLSPTTDGVYYFGFNAHSNFNASDLYLDDITIELGPDCPKPTNLYYSGVTDTSFHLSWSSVGNPSSWEIAYGQPGFDPTSANATIQTANQPEIDLEGLLPETTYQVYVRTKCNQNEYSSWSSSKTIKTNRTPPSNNLLCDAIELALSQECQAGPFSNLGAFMEEDEPFGSCSTYPAGRQSVWFSFTAPASGEATISTAFPETDFLTEITVYFPPTDCADLNTLGEEIACAGFGANLFLPDLLPQQTYFVKVTGSNDERGHFCINVWDENLSAPVDAFAQFKYYPNPVKTRLTLDSKRPIESLRVYNLAEKIVLKSFPDATKVQIPMGTLQSGIYLMEVRIGHQKKQIKLVKR